MENFQLKKRKIIWKTEPWEITVWPDENNELKPKSFITSQIIS